MMWEHDSQAIQFGWDENEKLMNKFNERAKGREEKKKEDIIWMSVILEF